MAAILKLAGDPFCARKNCGKYFFFFFFFASLVSILQRIQILLTLAKK